MAADGSRSEEGSKDTPGEPSGDGAPSPGSVAWRDITVDDADTLRDFYARVVGWSPAPVEMGGYSDYNMCNADGTPVAGICHARGENRHLPPVWLHYVVVADLDGALARTAELGGTVVAPVRSMGADRMAVILDPAGGHLALYEVGRVGGRSDSPDGGEGAHEEGGRDDATGEKPA